MTRCNGHTPRGMKTLPTTPEAEMAAFDALPPPIRARLRAAPIKLASAPLRDFWLEGPGDCRQRFAALGEALDAAGVPA